MAGNPGASSSGIVNWDREFSLAQGKTGDMGLPNKEGVSPAKVFVKDGGCSGGLGSTEEAGETSSGDVSVKANWVQGDLLTGVKTGGLGIPR